MLTPTERNSAIELLNAAADAAKFMEHEFGCEIDQTDFCTCGMLSAHKRLRRLHEYCRPNLVHQTHEEALNVRAN